jgi:hypothetical protein
MVQGEKLGGDMDLEQEHRGGYGIQGRPTIPMIGEEHNLLDGMGSHPGEQVFEVGFSGRLSLCDERRMNGCKPVR